MTVTPPAWLVSKVDQRMALMKDVIGHNVSISKQFEVMLTPLTEAPEGASPEEIQLWEYRCDNCGGLFPETLWTGVVRRRAFGVVVEFIFGACPACKDLP